MKEITHITVKLTFVSSIFLTVASQSSISIGLSPSVTMTIFRVHVFLFPRYCAWVSIPTMSASIAETRFLVELLYQVEIQKLTISTCWWCFQLVEFWKCSRIRLPNCNHLIYVVVASIGSVNNVLGVYECTVRYVLLNEDTRTLRAKQYNTTLVRLPSIEDLCTPYISIALNALIRTYHFLNFQFDKLQGPLQIRHFSRYSNTFWIFCFDSSHFPHRLWDIDEEHCDSILSFSSESCYFKTKTRQHTPALSATMLEGVRKWQRIHEATRLVITSHDRGDALLSPNARQEKQTLFPSFTHFCSLMSRQDKATTERFARSLRELVKRPENKVCADCKRNGEHDLDVLWFSHWCAVDPRWASWNLCVSKIWRRV